MDMKIIEKLKSSLNTGKNSILREIDYNEYYFTKVQRNFYIFCAILVLVVVSYIFYHSVIPGLAMSPVALFYPGIKKCEYARKRKEELLYQFRDLLYSLSGSLFVGKSLESAVIEARKDLMIQYPNGNESIIDELLIMEKKLNINCSVIECIQDFAKRTHIEEIICFSDILKACKKSGADLVEVIRFSAEIINEKIEIRNDIDIMISQKRLEQKILSIMPLVLLLILSVTTEDYMEPLFGTFGGKIAMTICAGLFGLGILLFRKVMNFEMLNESENKTEVKIKVENKQDVNIKDINIKDVNLKNDNKSVSLLYIKIGYLVLKILKPRFQSIYSRSLLIKCGETYGQDFAMKHLKELFARKISILILGFTVTYSLMLSSMGFDISALLFSIMFAVGLFFAPDKDLIKRANERKTSIQMEFPVFLNKLILLINSGMTVFSSWEKIASEGYGNGIFREEVCLVSKRIRNGTAESMAYEEFARRLRLHEVSKFVALLIQNVKKGGNGLPLLLKQIMDESWDMRKNAIRKLGEEASTKMLLPMAVMLIAVIGVVVMPAVLMLKG